MLPDSRRIYPQGELAAQVIGTVGVDNQGLTGLEASEDEVLHGTDGEREVVRDALGDELERNTIAGAEAGVGPAADDRRRPPGRDRERPRRDRRRPTSPTGATAIVMDPRTSEVLAMANWPRFDPTELGDAEPRRAAQHGDRLHLRARLDLQGVHGRRRARGRRRHAADAPSTCRRRSRSPTGRSRRRTRAATAALSVAEILAQSSNVGAVKIGLELNDEFGDSIRRRFDHWIRRFGFGAPTGIEFPGEEQGIVVPTPTTTRARRWATCRSARASR